MKVGNGIHKLGLQCVHLINDALNSKPKNMGDQLWPLKTTEHMKTNGLISFSFHQGINCIN